MEEQGYVSQQMTAQDALIWHVESSIEGLCRNLSVPGSLVSIAAVRNAIAGALPSTPAAKNFASHAAYVACALHDCEDFLKSSESFSDTGNFEHSDMTFRQVAAWTAALAVADFFDESATYTASNGGPLRRVGTILSGLSVRRGDVPVAVVELEGLIGQFRQSTLQTGERGPRLAGVDLQIVKSAPISLDPPRTSWFATTKIYAATWARQTYDKTPIRWRIRILMGASAASFAVGVAVGYLAWD